MPRPWPLFACDRREPAVGALIEIIADLGRVASPVRWSMTASRLRQSCSVPPFRNDPEEWQRADWRLLQNGFVHLYWSRHVLDGAVADLAKLGYRVVTLDAADWQTEQDALLAIGHALDFPEYFGRSLDAFRDCLRDVATFEYGSDESTAGTGLALVHFDRFVGVEPYAANVILDVFADCARFAMLIGHRMLCLVQSDEPNLRLAPVGTVAVLANPAEFGATRST